MPIRFCTSEVAMQATIEAGMVIPRISDRVKSAGSRVRNAAMAAGTGLAVMPSPDVTAAAASGRSGRTPLR